MKHRTKPGEANVFAMDNPYEILGVPEGASLDEVKRAYRKKARENHPDLNPDDPKAEERMNRVNEAYDRIVNPEKYAASDARRRNAGGSTRPGSAGGSAYGYPGGYPGSGADAGHGPNGPYGGPNAGPGPGNPYGYGNPYQPHGGSGEYGWTTINFEDLFGAGWENIGGTAQPVHPEAAAGDSPEMIQAINAINAKNPKAAIEIMQRIPSTGRNARWYYIFAIANNDAGNTVAAHDNIRRARQLDPHNPDYPRAEASFGRRAADYTQESQRRGFTTVGFDPTTLCCMCLCIGPTCCTPLTRMCLYGGLLG